MSYKGRLGTNESTPNLRACVATKGDEGGRLASQLPGAGFVREREERALAKAGVALFSLPVDPVDASDGACAGLVALLPADVAPVLRPAPGFPSQDVVAIHGRRPALRSHLFFLGFAILRFLCPGNIAEIGTGDRSFDLRVSRAPDSQRLCTTTLARTSAK